MPAPPVNLSLVFDQPSLEQLGSGARMIIVDQTTLAVVLGSRSTIVPGARLTVVANGTVTAARWPRRPLQAGSLMVSAATAPQARCQCAASAVVVLVM